MPSGVPDRALWVAAAALALLTAARFYGPPYRSPGSGSGAAVPLATPPGITLQLRNAKRARVATDLEWVYADSHGMTLYTNDEVNAHGTASCAGNCAVERPAALAWVKSAPEGEWSLVSRTDGTRQWAYRGAPLYGFANEKSIGDAAGDGGAWHAAVFRPGAGLALPDGIAVREIGDAAGAGLVDPAGMTLYASSADAADSMSPCPAPDCARHWAPLEAPAIANVVGEFAPLARADGITQWTYRHQPLYRFDGDRNPGEANGIDGGADIHVALVARFFMPAGTTLHRTLELGTVLATRTGAALYQRDRVATGAELHPFRTDHGSPALGRLLGTSACDAQCAIAWPPLAAPADAIATGYWDVVTRRDGSRQWAYKGFALYTHAADGPGDFKGNAVYDLDPIGNGTTRSDPPVPVNSPGIGVGAMFWHAVVP